PRPRHLPPAGNPRTRPPPPTAPPPLRPSPSQRGDPVDPLTIPRRGRQPSQPIHQTSQLRNHTIFKHVSNPKPRPRQPRIHEPCGSSGRERRVRDVEPRI